jgi:UDP-N-acetylmuramyl pentapeptide phosphotransferase/UDP-N-acetylglucosamine-1-phosphate transferase
MDLLLVLILATAVTVALIPLLERQAAALHVMDQPGERKVHERPVPRVGGIAMAVWRGRWFERPLAALVLAAVVFLLRPLSPFRLAPGWLVGALLLWALAEVLLLLWRPRRWR